MPNGKVNGLSMVVVVVVWRLGHTCSILLGHALARQTVGVVPKPWLEHAYPLLVWVCVPNTFILIYFLAVGNL